MECKHQKGRVYACFLNAFLCISTAPDSKQWISIFKWINELNYGVGNAELKLNHFCLWKSVHLNMLSNIVPVTENKIKDTLNL